MDMKTWLQTRGDDAAVAEMLGVSPWAVRAWRLGTRFPNVPTLVALVQASGGMIDYRETLEAYEKSAEAPSSP